MYIIITLFAIHLKILDSFIIIAMVRLGDYRQTYYMNYITIKNELKIIKLYYICIPLLIVLVRE